MRIPEHMSTRSYWHKTDVVIQSARSVLSGDGDGLRKSLARALEDIHEPEVDWREFERLADHHAVTPLFAHGLLQFGGDLVPQEVRAKLQERLQLIARNNLRWLAEWCRLMTAFEASGIPVIPLKGPIFAVQVYGNLALREFADLDLLVQPHDVLCARDVLAAEGYRPRFTFGANGDEMLLRSGNRQLEFVNRDRGMQIDLHWNALHTMFPFQLPVNDQFRTSQPAHYEGTQFLSLSPEHTLLYLCGHGTKHCWFRLRWLCDLAKFVQSAVDLDWGIAAAMAENGKCVLMVRHSLLLAKATLGLDLPPQAGSFSEDRRAQALADLAHSFLFRTRVNPSLTEEMRYHLAFAKGWRDRLHYLHHRILAPAEPDWSAMRLPQPLHPLYYFVRPARF